MLAECNSFDFFSMTSNLIPTPIPTAITVNIRNARNAIIVRFDEPPVVVIINGADLSSRTLSNVRVSGGELSYAVSGPV